MSAREGAANGRVDVRVCGPASSSLFAACRKAPRQAPGAVDAPAAAPGGGLRRGARAQSRSPTSLAGRRSRYELTERRERLGLVDWTRLSGLGALSLVEGPPLEQLRPALALSHIASQAPEVHILLVDWPVDRQPAPEDVLEAVSEGTELGEAKGAVG